MIPHSSLSRPVILWVALGLMLLLPTACSRQTPPAALPPLSDLNVLLIVIDTMGADYAGCLGGPESLTPNIDRLAASGVLFSDAISPAPWTQPAVASLMTGLTPSRHRALHLFDSLPDTAETLAEFMSGQGHRTSGVISHFLIGDKLGYARGFGTYDESAVGGHKAISSPRVTHQAIAQIKQAGPDPFFVFAHYFDPHSRYLHHRNFDRTSQYNGPAREMNLEITQLRARRGELEPADIAYLRGLYEEEIAYTDKYVGDLLQALQDQDLARNTLVILTADHGEEFMEHDWIGHTRYLYDTLVRVPLIVSLPGVLEPDVVSEPVSTLDIMPTLLALGGAVREGLDGRSLLPALQGGQAQSDRAVFSEVAFIAPENDPPADKAEKEAFLAAVVRGRWKLIHNLATDDWTLYDRQRDPGEMNDVLDRQKDEAAELRTLLLEWERGKVESWGKRLPGAQLMSEQERRKLRSLGYIR
jgi:arylsulfatase A-like enzyme